MLLRFSMLAAVFLFSCTGVERDNPYDSGGINYKKGNSSSSSVKPLSSSSVFACSNVGGYSCDMSGYRTVEINGQVWMAQNLNCDVEGSYCYDRKTENCDRYGRLYDWCTAKVICPSGWHLPSNEEWQELVDFAGGKDVAGKYLKADNGWYHYGKPSGNGEDKFDFSALPGGRGDYGSFNNIGTIGYWWSASDYGDILFMDGSESAALGNVSNKNVLFSVRCLKN